MSSGVRDRLKEAIQGIDFKGMMNVSFGVDDYYDVLRGIVENRGRWSTVLVSASMPHRLLLDTLDSLGTDVDGIRSIDCISFCLLGDQHGEAIYIESPAVLEKVLMSLELIHRESGGQLLVIVDSFNAFYLHNDHRSMSAFLQILAYRLKNAGDVGILLSLKDQATDENDNMLRLLSERSLQL
ncbi:MAG: hypothetical protein AB7E27_04715 [Candidatus Methanomethylophilaceae archaeon]